MIPIWKIFLAIGGLFLALGLILWVGERLSIPLGRLPGDIRIEKKNFSFYFPLATSLLLSLGFSLVAILISKLRK